MQHLTFIIIFVIVTVDYTIGSSINEIESLMDNKLKLKTKIEAKKAIRRGSFLAPTDKNLEAAIQNEFRVSSKRLPVEYDRVKGPHVPIKISNTFNSKTQRRFDRVTEGSTKQYFRTKLKTEAGERLPTESNLKEPGVTTPVINLNQENETKSIDLTPRPFGKETKKNANKKRNKNNKNKRQ